MLQDADLVREAIYMHQVECGQIRDYIVE